MKGATIGLTLSVVIGLLSGCGPLTREPMTVEQYTAVEMEMTEDQVRELLGPPQKRHKMYRDSRGNNSTEILWYYEDADVLVGFQSGKVIYKKGDGFGKTIERKGDANSCLPR